MGIGQKYQYESLENYDTSEDEVPEISPIPWKNYLTPRYFIKTGETSPYCGEYLDSAHQMAILQRRDFNYNPSTQLLSIRWLCNSMKKFKSVRMKLG